MKSSNRDRADVANDFFEEKDMKEYTLKLNEKEDIYLCAWVEPVSGSMCLHSGGFIFSVIKRPILFMLNSYNSSDHA